MKRQLLTAGKTKVEGMAKALLGPWKGLTIFPG
jgi:hypothetical protein